MPYADPKHKKQHNRKYGAAWSKRNRDRKNAAYARYTANPLNKAKVRAVARNAHLVRKYGITSADFDALSKTQKHKCALCGGKKPLVVDHCHVSGVVRGLLCSLCNRWLGIYESWKNKGVFDAYLEAARAQAKDFDRRPVASGVKQVGRLLQQRNHV